MNILVSGHRRSGTHLLEDIIVNNFNYKRATVDIDCLKKLNKRDIDTFYKESEQHNIVFWTHSNNIQEIININDVEFKKYVISKVLDMKIIVILRDGRDVMLSYSIMKKVPSILGFMKYSLQNWIDNVTYWKNYDYIKYEDIIKNYDGTIKKISEYINKKPSHLKDVRITSISDQKNDIKYSHREFRKGIIGDYKNYFNQQELDFFNSKCYNLMKELKYD